MRPSNGQNEKEKCLLLACLLAWLAGPILQVQSLRATGREEQSTQTAKKDKELLVPPVSKGTLVSVLKWPICKAFWVFP